MGKADMAMSEYLENRKRFADLFNGILFRGKQVIREEELSEASPSYRFREPGEGSGKGKREGKLSGRSRDVKMCLKSGEVLRDEEGRKAVSGLYDLPVPWGEGVGRLEEAFGDDGLWEGRGSI